MWTVNWWWKSKTVSTCYYQLRKLYHLCRLVSLPCLSWSSYRRLFYNALITVNRSCQLPGIYNGVFALCSVCKTMQPVLFDGLILHMDPLVAHSIPNSIQNVRFYAPVFSSPLSTVHIRFSQLHDGIDFVPWRQERPYVTHRSRTNLGRRAFSIAGPSLWNSLPQSLRLIDDHEQFRKQLKTYYFNVAFS